MEEIDIQRIHLGDTKAFKPLFEKYYYILKNFALKYLHNEDIAKDIAQETLLKYWQRRKKFNNIYTITSFLFTTTKNAVFSELRHRKVVVGSKSKILETLNNDYISLYEKDTVQEMYQRLEKEINSLPPRTAQIIRLQLAGFKEQEIAEQLEIGKETVRTLKKLGNKKLKESMSLYKNLWDIHYTDFQA